MLVRLIHRGTSPDVLRLVAILGVCGWVLGFAVHFASLNQLTDRRGKPIGGDFISFYTAGRLVLEGRTADLYDLRIQQQTQARIVEKPEYRDLCSFVNPPIVAVAYAPLAALPFRWAYLLHTAVLAAALVFGLRLLLTQLPKLREHATAVIGIGLLFYPFTITITGGQNTAITFLLIAATYVHLCRRHGTLAGLTLGLLLFKPQFTLVIGLLMLMRGWIRPLLVAGVVGGGYYLIGAAACGLWWPAEMLDALKAYWPLEHQYNGTTSISLIGFCEQVFAAGVFKPIGIGAALLVVAVTAWIWRHTRLERSTLAMPWAVAVCATVLVSPHTQWYDGGLVLLAVLVAIDEQLAAGRSFGTLVRVGLVLGFCLPPCRSLGSALGWQPLILLPAVTFAVLLSRSMSLRGERQQAPPKLEGLVQRN